MSNKAKIGGRSKVVQHAAARVFVIRPDGELFGAYCITTGRLISLCHTAHLARKRAGKKGWGESVVELDARPTPLPAWAEAAR